MPAGRPAKPIEQKRLLGNPGKRALPDESSIVLMQQIDSVPEPPRPLLKYGNDLWERIWGWAQPGFRTKPILSFCL